MLSQNQKRTTYPLLVAMFLKQLPLQDKHNMLFMQKNSLIFWYLGIWWRMSIARNSQIYAMGN